MDEVISILIIVSGIYVLYAAIRLKNDGQINKSLMISPSQPADRTKSRLRAGELRPQMQENPHRISRRM